LIASEILSESKNQNEFKEKSMWSMVQAQTIEKSKSIGRSLVSVKMRQRARDTQSCILSRVASLA